MILSDDCWEALVVSFAGWEIEKQTSFRVPTTDRCGFDDHRRVVQNNKYHPKKMHFGLESLDTIP